MGLSERTAILVLCFLAAIGGGLGNLLRQAEAWSIAAGGLFVLAMGLFAVYLARIKVYDDAALAAPAGGPVTPLVGEFLYKRRVAEVMLDFCLITIAYYGAYHLRFEGGEYLANVESFYASVPVVLATQLVAFFIVGVYRGVWRHFGLMDGVTIVKGVVLGTAATQLILMYGYPAVSTSRTVLLIYAILLGVLVTISRASFRLMGEFVQRQSSASRRGVIYGAGENAAVALRELLERQGTALRLLGFVDDDPRIARMRVQGYPVLGTFDALTAFIEARAVDVVILNHALDEERLAALETRCESAGVTLLRLQVSIEELISTGTPSPATRLRAQFRKRGG
jgi:UDP-GlcNAc:undecaprenyl-phosphate GlcNAc-1-phosphate transferase